MKEKNSRTIPTLFGEVTYKRRYYYDQEKNNWTYLLDESLKLESGKRISPGLAELVVLWATKGTSYRDARDRLADIYGAQIISHETIRQVLLNVAAYIEREDENKIVEEHSRKPVDALFIETDGFYAHMQYAHNKKQRRREVKLAIIHEGWKVRQGKGKKKDYCLKNPTYVPILDLSKDFWEEVRGVIDSKYEAIDSIPVIINGLKS